MRWQTTRRLLQQVMCRLHIPFFFSKDRGELSALLKKKKNRRPARGHGLQGLRAPAFYFLVFVFRLTPFYAFKIFFNFVFLINISPI